MQLRVGIVGGGPAGSACAITLAGNGHSVTIFEKYSLPRAKACGDALIPDAIGCLEHLGVMRELLPLLFKVPRLRLVSPSGIPIDVEGSIYTCERQHLDSFLLEKARGLGVRVFVKEVVSVEQEARAVRIRCRDGFEEEFDFVVGASGASAKSLALYGTAYRKRPSAYAMRQYVEVSHPHNMDAITVFYNKETSPAYGWVFPLGPRRLNIGIGLIANRRRDGLPNLFKVYEKFITENELCARAFADSTRRGILQGAPLRTGLRGSQFSNGRLLLCGETIGATYAMTGEGIGKALETGIVAAETLSTFCRNGSTASAEQVGVGYGKAINRRMKRKFSAYDLAEKWMSYPRIVDFLAENANKNRGIQNIFDKILADTCSRYDMFPVKAILSAIIASASRHLGTRSYR